MVKNSIQKTFGPTYNKRIFKEFTNQLVSDPNIALVELVANSWDAGANKVYITWPKEGDIFEIKDNGTGMTKKEFIEIWQEVGYNRLDKNGSLVDSPDPSIHRKRRAFGRNGKGRHSLFCFSDEYYVNTWKNGHCHTFKVTNKGSDPFNFNCIKKGNKEGNGTKISCKLVNHYINEQDVIDLLGSKFITNTDFSIYVNNSKIKLIDLSNVTTEKECHIPGEEEKVQILRISSSKAGRLSKHHGVAWWVNDRKVKENSWESLEGAYLDGRSPAAKKHTFLIFADILKDEVNPEWTDFKKNERTEKILKHVENCIFNSIQELMQDARKESKIIVLEEHREKLVSLSDYSLDLVGETIDNIQKSCPRISRADFKKLVELLIKMEESRTGFLLLKQLANIPIEDIDTLTEIISDWDIKKAKIVLDELHSRIALIEEIELIMDNPKTKELTELHPLFEKGLWIFGPEYEGFNFTSNQKLSTVMNKLFGGGNIKESDKRPDFVSLPDSSASIYNSYKYDKLGNISGYDKVLIVELKRGGHKLTINNLRQAEDYARRLRSTEKLKDTNFVCFVLGSKIDEDAEEDTNQLIRGINTIPMRYDVVIGSAKARTFNLMDKIHTIKKIPTGTSDDEIKEVLKSRPLIE